MSDPLFQALVESNRRLTETVENKTGEIDSKVDTKINEVGQRMDQAEQDLANWKATTSYIQSYSISEPEKLNDGATGHYHLIQLYRIKNRTSALNPWIHFGYTGGNVVGSASFNSLTQSHAQYTGQNALFANRGNGEIKFFVDKTNEADAPVYMAIKNSVHNNASVLVNIASNMALNVVRVGAVDLEEWKAANAKALEITLIDLTSSAV
ncbi:TPA: hypothetical protein RQK36_003973 [Vibrio vulnificus]|nr:hypothetical protein [Vibrio vulnificus]